METEKLYYKDCHLRQFTARVIACTQAQKGWEVQLDATAFYPEGGGQASDLGTLGGANVLYVFERGEAVIHLCDKPLSVGETVRGEIQWERRFDFMQQHTGEHIVSGLIHKYFGYHNTGFHMGEQLMEVDFDGLIPADMLARIEKEANEAVFANLPLRCWYPREEELPTVGYRTKKELPWPVRVVEVPGYDKCACCGVHVAYTGEVGIIKILSCTKLRGGVRLEMVCGGRALRYLSRICEENRQVSQAFSAKVLETGAAARKMNEQLAAEKFRAAALERRLMDKIASGYAGKNAPVLRFEEGMTGGSLRELAEKIALSCGRTAAVLCESDGGFDVCLASPGADIKPLGTAMSKALQGRGGGKPGFFQGKLRCSREKATEFFAEQGFLTE